MAWRYRPSPDRQIHTTPTRISIFQHNESNDCGSDTERDYPLDEFDRELLAQNFGNHAWAVKDQLAASSMPTPTPRPFARGHAEIRKEKPFETCQQAATSFSPNSLVSIPALSALQYENRTSQPANPYRPDVQQVSPQTPQHRGTSATSSKTRGTRRPAFLTDSSHGPPVIRGIPLVPTHILPDNQRAVFGFELFNAVQSKCFATAYKSDDNIVVSAPTGSGKTVVMELAICRLIAQEKYNDFKIVYQAPTKSLCGERNRDWTAKFKTLGLQCAELTGDADHIQLKNVQSAQIIVATPEKWDSVTRRWKDNARLMKMIKLFLVDEVHILRESRGATLEAVVSRMKSVGSAVRFVALSATVPNSEDIAAWLGLCPISQHLPAHREVFDESFRPVKLEKHVLGYRCSPNTFALDSMLTKEIPMVIDRHSNNKPVMVFCVTRNAASKTATAIAEHRLRFLGEEPHRDFCQRYTISDSELAKVIPIGVAFHHSGLESSDRQAVERGFIEGAIKIICSTSTLAVGVNLPCYLVILKGTSTWSDNGLQEYSSLDVMQMLGRAGRPQYEKSACAVILTHNEKIPHYQKMVSSQEILESALHRNLIEHLNAEIGIGTVKDIESAKKWLNSTFLSVRLRQNPEFYHLEGHDAATNESQLLKQICQRDLHRLESAHLIDSKNEVRCTEYGEAMARYYIQFQTMLVFMKLPSKPRISDILNAVAQAQELSHLKIRAGEKSMYKHINQSNDTRYPFKVDLALPVHKVSLLIQTQLGSVNVLDEPYKKYASQFRQDSLMVMTHCNRLVRCIIDIQVHRGDSTGARNALELCRSLAAGAWDNTPMQLKQIESIGEATTRKLAAAGINSVETLLNTEAQRIDIVMGKSQPFGSTLLKKAAGFPSLRISVKKTGEKRKANTGVDVQLKCEIGFLNAIVPTFFNRKAVYVCFLCETSTGKLVDFRRFSAQRLRNGEGLHLTVVLDEPCDSIRCHVMCDEVAGTHRFAELAVDIPSTYFPSKATVRQISEGQKVQELGEFGDFDDASVVDDDFLVAESQRNHVKRLDEGEEQVLGTSTSLKLSVGPACRPRIVIDKVSQPETSLKEFRAPKRLTNGNWTCQHACNGEGKDCKHQCCKEGVKKPKKRAKTSLPQSKTTGSTIKDALAGSSSNTSKSFGGRVRVIDESIPQTPDSYYTSFQDDQSLQHENCRLNVRPKPRGTSTRPLVADVDDLYCEGLSSAGALISHSVARKAKANTDARGGQASGIFDGDDDDDDVFEFEDDWLSGADCDWDTSAILKSNDRSEPSVNDDLSGHSAPIDTFEFTDDIEDIELVDLDTETEQVAVPIDSTNKSEPSLTSPSDRDSPNSKRNSELAGTRNIETREQRDKRIHKEDQERKWSGLPEWMYREYGDVIDLI